jgi:hypothetical protein
MRADFHDLATDLLACVNTLKAHQEAERDAVYANRRRIRGDRGKRLLRKRGELLEQLCAHLYETGGLRRAHVRGHENVLKRLLVHAGAFNLGLWMRARFGIGTPRGPQGRLPPLGAVLRTLWSLVHDVIAPNLESDRSSETFGATGERRYCV